MEQSEVELNEKLAKWAGFYRLKMLGSSRRVMWDRSGLGFFDPPQFTSSLDWCFDYLVPKCGHVGLSTAGGNFDVTVWAKDTDSEYEGIMVRETTPALALCKAIEKLIDSTK